MEPLLQTVYSWLICRHIRSCTLISAYRQRYYDQAWYYNIFFFLWRCSPAWVMTSSFLMRFLDHTQQHTTVGRTPLDEWSAGRRDLYLTTHNTHNRQTSMPPAGFEPIISVVERPQTYALDRAATGTCGIIIITNHNQSWHIPALNLGSGNGYLMRVIWCYTQIFQLNFRASP